MNLYMAIWLSAGSSENGEIIELPYLVSVLCNATYTVVYQLLHSCMILSYYTHQIKGNVI